MANNNVQNVRLLRNGQLFTTRQSALDTLTRFTYSNDQDGSVILARYTTGGEPAVKTIVGFIYATDNVKTVTIFDLDGMASASDIDTINEKLGTGVTTANTVTLQLASLSGSNSDTSATTSVEGAKKYADAQIGTAISALDVSDSAVAGNYVSQVTETDGKISVTRTALPSVDAISGQGYAITAVSESLGAIDAEYGDIAAEHVTVADSGSLLTATTVEGALAEIAGKVSAAEVKSTDKTIIVTTSSTGTDIAVNIDGKTILKDGTTGVISTGLKLVRTAGTGTTKETYALTDSTGGTITGSDTITINKDQAFITAQLGHNGATVNQETGAITDGSGEDVLILEYQNAEGTYVLVQIPLGDFLRESEFKDGLVVDGSHQVKVSADSASESVITSYTTGGTSATTASVLSVSPTGVKVNNIQTAIDAKVGTLDASLTGGTTAGTATAGHVQVAVTEVDGKLTALVVNEANIADASDIAALSAKSITEITSSNSSITPTVTSASDGTVSVDLDTDASLIKMTGFESEDSLSAITSADTITEAFEKLDEIFTENEYVTAAALNDLESRKLENIVVNTVSGSVSNHVASVTIDGGDIYMTGYQMPDTTTAVTPADTVNQAIGKLEKKIESSGGDITGEAAARKAVDGVNGDVYTADTNANYINTATSLYNADVLLDAAIKSLSDDAIKTVKVNNQTLTETSNAVNISISKANATGTDSSPLTVTTGNDGAVTLSIDCIDAGTYN